MKRWLGVTLTVIIGVPVLAYGIGLFIPRDHVAARSVDLMAPPDRVWALISAFENTPSWRPDVARVTMLPPVEGKARFVEAGAQGDVTFEVINVQPPLRQVVRVVDDDQPFGGIWTWQIEALLPDGGEPAKTRVTITEAGFIKNPLFRAMGLLFFSPTDTIDSYLAALAAALGERPAAPTAGS